jgi:hypothetical protein
MAVVAVALVDMQFMICPLVAAIVVFGEREGGLR